MLPCHGREAKERGSRDKGTMGHYQKEATSVSPAFSNWRRESWGVISISSVFIKPQTKCYFWSLLLLLLYSIFQILLYRANLDHSRRFEPILCRNDYKWKSSTREFRFRTGFRFPLFQPESHVAGVDYLALTAWTDIMWNVILNLLQRYYQTEFAISVSPL